MILLDGRRHFLVEFQQRFHGKNQLLFTHQLAVRTNEIQHAVKILQCRTRLSHIDRKFIAHYCVTSPWICFLNTSKFACFIFQFRFCHPDAGEIYHWILRCKTIIFLRAAMLPHPCLNCRTWFFLGNKSTLSLRATKLLEEWQCWKYHSYCFLYSAG